MRTARVLQLPKKMEKMKGERQGREMWKCQKCGSLAELDVSEWNTSQVTNMDFMFKLCSSLKKLDVRGWDTSQVTIMNSMFEDCGALMELDISGFDMSNVTDSEDMLKGTQWE